MCSDNYFICTVTSYNHFAPTHPLMCFACTKTLKSLKEYRSKHIEDLGFNLDDSYDYVEYNKAMNNDINSNSFRI